MGVRVDPHLGLEDLLVLEAEDLCRSIHLNFRTFPVFSHTANLDRCKRNVWVDGVQQHPCRSTWRCFSALQPWPTSAEWIAPCQQTNKQTNRLNSPHFHPSKIIMQLLYRFVRFVECFDVVFLHSFDVDFYVWFAVISKWSFPCFFLSNVREKKNTLFFGNVATEV